MNKNSKIPRKATRLKHKSKELDSINKSHEREAYTYHEEEKERDRFHKALASVSLSSAERGEGFGFSLSLFNIYLLYEAFKSEVFNFFL